MSCLREQRKAALSAEKTSKKLKKVLDKSRTTWSERTCSAAEADGRVPGKLNNVTNEKHQSSVSVMDIDEKMSCEPGFSQLPGERQRE